ncbi:MAG: hypothetical protein LUH07_01710 [Lachnospiraceae bacterium]|nr:hypothetical protein [Lachnospiraceae bacterium]
MEAVSEEAAAIPITAVYANEEMLKEYSCVEYFAADSGQLVTLAFRPNEDLTDVQFYLLEYSEDGSWRSAEELYALSGLKPGNAFVAGVEFYGDMTAYGISFTDAAGDSRSFAVQISGRNGGLLMDEYE